MAGQAFLAAAAVATLLSAGGTAWALTYVVPDDFATVQAALDAAIAMVEDLALRLLDSRVETATDRS